MEREENASKLILGFFVIDTIISAILFSIVEIYTLYYFFANEGFWAGFFALVTPIINAIGLFFKLLPIEGLTGGFSIMFIATVVTFIISIIPFIFKR